MLATRATVPLQSHAIFGSHLRIGAAGLLASARSFATIKPIRLTDGSFLTNMSLFHNTIDALQGSMFRPDLLQLSGCSGLQTAPFLQSDKHVAV